MGGNGCGPLYFEEQKGKSGRARVKNMKKTGTGVKGEGERGCGAYEATYFSWS